MIVLYTYQDIRLTYESIVNSYMIRLPSGRSFGIPAENLEDLINVLEVAKNYRDHGILPDVC